MSAPVTEAHIALSNEVLFKHSPAPSFVGASALKAVAQLIADSEARATDQLRAELALLREWQREVIQNANAHHAERRDAIARAESAEREAFDWKKIARYETARAERAEAELDGIRALANRRNKRYHIEDTTHQLVAALDQALDIAQAELADLKANNRFQRGHSAGFAEAKADCEAELATELATERARLRQLALDACRAAAIVPLVWYPTGYYVNPNDLGKINKQQVDACVSAIDAAMKEGA